MSFQTCPADIVEAPVDQVWELLIQPRRLAAWVGAKLLAGPSRALQIGDQLVLGVGPAHRAKVVMHVLAQKRPEHLELHIQLPFGLINHEVIRLRAIDAGRCQVTFN